MNSARGAFREGRISNMYGGMGGMGNMAGMMKKVQKLQSQMKTMQEELKKRTVEMTE